MGLEKAAIRRVESFAAKCMSDFRHNHKVGKWVVDLVHPLVKIIVEVNGDCWHGNPGVYPLDTYQRRWHDRWRE